MWIGKPTLRDLVGLWLAAISGLIKAVKELEASLPPATPTEGSE